MRARGFGGLALGAQQRGVQHVLHERRFAGPRHTGNAHQALERDRNVDVLEIVIGGSNELDLCAIDRHGNRRGPIGTLAACEIIPGERTRVRHQLRGRAKEDDPPAVLAGPRSDVERMVRGEHDLRVVFDDDERVAGVAQPLHDADHATHVARMQAYRRLVEDE